MPARLLARALGGRDVALGLGPFLARSRGDIRLWLVMAVLADATDAAATIRSWSALPRRGRFPVVLAAGGAAVIGAVGVMGSAADKTGPDRA